MTANTIAAQVFTALLTILLPLGGMLLLRHRGGSWRVFLAGAATFILSAMVLERVLHVIVLSSPLAGPLQENIWLYALYGGLAAGVFEETGRLAVFKLLTRKDRPPVVALSFGLGHGGCEAILIVGLTMVNNLIVTAMAASGSLSDPALSAAAEALVNTPASMFLWAGFERIGAMLLHVANSMLVFTAVRRRQFWLFALAVGTHALLDIAAVIMNQYCPIAVTELTILALALLIFLWSWRIWRKPDNLQLQ